MAGNELEVARFLLENRNKISLNHIGLVRELGAPEKGNGYRIIDSISDLELVKTQHASKKADLYINGHGVSLKQKGGSFAFNRIQRSELLELLSHVGISNPEQRILTLDNAVNDFHSGLVKGRSRPWEQIFKEEDFKSLTRYLMMEGSPNTGDSSHPADYILEAPKSNYNENNIAVYSFDEYFANFKMRIKVALRRQWIGQISESEHKRASGLVLKPLNKPWVYKTIVGQPRVSKLHGTRWRTDVPVEMRRTVYFLFLEKK